MKTRLTKTLAVILAAVMLICCAPLSGFVGLDTDGIFAEKAAAESYSVGDIIEFGSYPQSRVTDSATVEALDGISKNWISYGYYSGTGDITDGQMEPGDYMQYADLQYGDSTYRAVYFTSYRPYYTGYQSSASYTYQDDNGYNTNTVYYFKYEPLKWRVLDPSTGLIMCEDIIDSQAYQNTVYKASGEYWQDTTQRNYANDYANSSIRKWLNEDFYNTAFSEAQKSNIETTALNNDCFNTGTSYDKFDSAATNDKIFLLSYDDSKNSAYGFSSDASTDDTARQASGTDYAECQGLCVYSNECSWWWLRSPYNYSYYACYVGSVGNSYSYGHVNRTYGGVRPACKISNPEFDTCDHSWTVATCTEPQTCSLCGATQGEANGHTPADAVRENEVLATCKAAGSYDEVVYCSVAECKEELSREAKTIEIDADAHTGTATVIKNDKAATCYAEGYTGDTYWSCCDTLYAQGEAIEKTAHTHAEAVRENKVDATCTAAGSYDEVVYCSVAECKEELSREAKTIEIDADAHTGTATVIKNDKAATCYAEGYTGDTYWSCCDTLYAQGEAIEKTVHSFGKWIETKAPSCSANGEEKRECANCDAFETREVKKLPHTEEIIPGKEASCTETGLTEGIKCSVCGEIIKAQTIIPITHSDEDDDGICDDCGENSDNRCRCSCHSNSFFAKLIRLIRSMLSLVFGKEVYCCEDMEFSVDIGALT